MRKFLPIVRKPGEGGNSPSIRKFALARKGATMIEYALVVGLIAVVAIAGVTTFGTNLKAAFNNIAGYMSPLGGAGTGTGTGGS